MDWTIFISFLVLTVNYQIMKSEVIEGSHSENCTTTFLDDNDTGSRVLSRRKRFLTFPEGSSFQLVFCVQTAALIPIGDIFLYGNTAALAWTLPSDPEFFQMFKKHTNIAQRRGDSKTEIFYIDDKGKLIAKVPYKRKPIINPAFAKRSVDEQDMTFKEKLKIKIDRMKMHENQLNRVFLKKDNMNENSVEFHRISRVGLYDKIEKLITALGRDGRKCILYKLCESARGNTLQGTFLQELLRVVFTLPKGKEFEVEEYKAYDKVHTHVEDCSARYPGCDDFEVPIQI